MKNILVVDDNDLILLSLSVGLGECVRDARILTARHGGEAVEILESQTVDCIITDLHMPVMSGYDLIAYVNRNHPNVPLYVMTGECPSVVKGRFPAGTVNRFVPKPFNITLLASEISSMLDLGEHRHLFPA